MSLQKFTEYFTEGNESLGYSLRLYSNSRIDIDDGGYTLTGQLYGFGQHGGNYSGEEWLKKNLPPHTVISYEDYKNGHDGVNFDSEQGQFYCYSNRPADLYLVVNTLSEAFNKAREAVS